MQYDNIEAINRTYQHVYISPHLDDIAFSCSGLIARQVKAGETVLVVTVFTADPGSGKRPLDPALQHVVDMPRRRAEDQKAMNVMGVDYLWLDHPDWVFRHRHALYRYSIRPGWLKGELELSALMTSQIKAVCGRARNQYLYLPLGIGQHADHQMVFHSGIASRQQGSADMQVVFYEEMPYVLFPNLLHYRLMALGQDLAQSREPDLQKPLAVLPATRSFIHALRQVPTLLGNNAWMRWFAYCAIWGFQVYIRFLMRPRRGRFHPGSLVPQQKEFGPYRQNKFAAIACYDSQIGHIRDYPEKMEQMLQLYAHNIGDGTKALVERYWKWM